MTININIYPILVTWKRSNRTGLCPLHLRVDIDGKRAALPSLKRKLHPDHWDHEKKLVKKSCPNASLINAYIAKKKNALDEEYLKKQLLGITLTREGVREIARGTSPGNDFYKFCRQQIDLNGYAAGTVRIYKSEINKMERFSPTCTFRDIDLDFVKRFEKYMRETLLNANNTIWKTTKFLNTMLNLAVGIHIVSNPLKGHQRTKYKQRIPEYLEWTEVLRIKDVLVRNIALPDSDRIFGYCFFLSCVSGLRFSDVMKFNYDKYVAEDSSGRRLVLRTTKTGSIVSIGFTDDIAFAVDYLRSKKITGTNQHFNRNIKLVGVLAEIDKPLKSHMGRHTFGMRCAELGMRDEDVQKLLGHSDIDTTRIYFRIKNTRLDQAMQAWNTDEPPKNQGTEVQANIG